MDVFKVRLNCIDHYQATPTQYDPCLRNDVRHSQLFKEPKVPVIRVFGSTQTGQKVCAHIHGAFPYLFIEYNGKLDQEEVGAFSYRLHLSIDHALAVSYRQDAYARDTPKYVARITLVKGVPFYGFHVGYKYYLKIYMLNPVVMTRLADLLHQGVIMKRKFQPYEAHLQYILQFMTDYNLYGCGYIEASSVKFRAPVPQIDDDDMDSVMTPHIWHNQSISQKQITDHHSLPRASHCPIEVDICVQDILNRKDVKERRLHHDFVERLNPLPTDMKLVASMAGLWRDETKRRKRQLGISDPKSSPFPAEVLVSMSHDPRDSQPAGWLHEEEFRAEIEELITTERANDDTDITFDSFVPEPPPLDSAIKTVLESVEDLYPQHLEASLGEMSTISVDFDPASSIDVDERGARRLGRPETMDEDPCPDDSDEERLREAQRLEEAKKEKALQDYPTTASINGLVGLDTSSLITGKRPEIPITQELIDAAIEEDLLSEVPAPLQTPILREGLKRHAHPKYEDHPSKRPRIRPARINNLTFVPPEDGLRARYERRAANVAKAESQPPSSSQRQTVDEAAPFRTPLPRKSSMMHNSASKSVNRKLSFAVVKDPNDPETKLRLSQNSNSQGSDTSETPKLLSFDSSLPDPEEASPQKEENQEFYQVGQLPNPFGPSDKSQEHDHSEDEVFAHTSMVPVSHVLPPTAEEVCATMADYGIPDVVYRDAYYSKEKDVPLRPREFAGRQFRLRGNTLPYLPEFTADRAAPDAWAVPEARLPDKSKLKIEEEIRRNKCTIKTWEIAQPPPTFEEVSGWWEEKEIKKKESGSRPKSHPASPQSTQLARRQLSQIEGATPKNKHGFRYSQKQKTTSVQHEVAYMSTMSIEIHVNTRGKLVPDPEKDEVKCIFWCVRSDDKSNEASSQAPDGLQSGVVVLSEEGTLAERIKHQIKGELLEETSELDLMVRMVEIVRTHDPDILTGYEVHGGSWGYLIERARCMYDYNLCDEFSRMKSQSHGRYGKDADRWGFNTTSTIRVTGRHMINIWRAMRGELNLLQYTMENVVWHLLHRRIPHYSWQTLTTWYGSGRHGDLDKLLRYYQTRTRLDIEILEENGLISRTSEQARLLGVDFFSVFSRGSQFKVESIMFRIAKPENFMLVSPSRKQVGGQNALECLPLVMEPQSAFYNSPVLVLDFQSLYPSVMIAYNYCYSTFLGRIVDWRGTNKMGFAEYRRRKRLLELLQEHINIAPNGVMYTKPEIRKSLLAKMLTEILETRVMVKSGMKQDKDDKTLQQLLNNRQLALKLLANVTYGYTSASFSGRLPCSEIADSIVQTGRETLERAIAFIHSVPRWGAEVVYGDTDSLFIHLKGRTKEQAFEIGNEMAKAITDMNPRPMKLKFEKVYLPCVLLAKKRYVGYKYEHVDQQVPDFDAKGIETVRRDGTPAEQKIEEKALRLLFETADLSQIKEYFQRQCNKIMRGQVSIQDFCFAKEVKLGTYSDRNGVGPAPPGALISTKKMLADPRAEPQYGERVLYVVVTGAPGARLADRCVPPEDMLSPAGAHLRLDADYYISKNLIPPLERIFNLVGAHIRGWYDELPKVQQVRRVVVDSGNGHNSWFGSIMGNNGAQKAKKVTLESYLQVMNCAVCNVRIRPATQKKKTPAPRQQLPPVQYHPLFGFGRFGPRPPPQPAPKKKKKKKNPANDVVVCGRCTRHAQESLLKLHSRLAHERKRFSEVADVCRSCAGLAPGDVASVHDCDSKDCPVFYTRVKQATKLRTEMSIVEPVIKQLEARVAKMRKQAWEW